MQHTDVHELGVVRAAIAPLTTPSSTPIGFVALYSDRYDAMVRLAVLLVDRVELAEEIVQDAFAAVYERWEYLDTPGSTHRDGE